MGCRTCDELKRNAYMETLDRKLAVRYEDYPCSECGWEILLPLIDRMAPWREIYDALDNPPADCLHA